MTYSHAVLFSELDEMERTLEALNSNDAKRQFLIESDNHQLERAKNNM